MNNNNNDWFAKYNRTSLKKQNLFTVQQQYSMVKSWV